MIMKGKISKIWINRLDDGRTYATLSINGERYTLWDKKYIDSLKEGDVIKYEFKQAGRFKNIKNISKLQKIKDAESIGYSAGMPSDYDLRKDREIVRMSCLKSALYMTRDFLEMSIEERVAKAISVARQFEKYITEDDFLKPDDEEPWEHEE